MTLWNFVIIWIFDEFFYPNIFPTNSLRNKIWSTTITINLKILLTANVPKLVIYHREENPRASVKERLRAWSKNWKRKGTSWTVSSQQSPPMAPIPPNVSLSNVPWTAVYKWPAAKGFPTWSTPGSGDGQICTKTNWNKSNTASLVSTSRPIPYALIPTTMKELWAPE